MKVMHTYCLNNNLGDYALGIGVKNIFRELFNVDLFADSNLQGQSFDDYFIDIINQKYDLLIIGGGGIIHGSHWPQGWFWLIKQQLIKKIKIPFIVYGAGYNYFKDENGIPQRGIDHLKETQSHSAFFSVRKDGSFERLLNQTGIKAEVIANPGFWLPLGRNFKLFIKEKYVVVQLANDKPLHRFVSIENRDAFIKNMIVVLNELADKYKIVFAPHVYEDIEISENIAKEVKNSIVMDFSKFAFDRAIEFMGIYQNASFVLGMRGHGQIIPLGFGSPVISLENHDKHCGLMLEYGLGEYNINILDKEFVKKTRNLVHSLIDNSDEIKNFIKQKNSSLLIDTKSKLEKIIPIQRFLR